MISLLRKAEYDSVQGKEALQRALAVLVELKAKGRQIEQLEELTAHVRERLQALD